MNAQIHKSINCMYAYNGIFKQNFTKFIRTTNCTKYEKIYKIYCSFIKS